MDITQPKKPFPVVSPSSLLDFEGCAKRWHEVRILKKHPFTVTEAITYGNTTHDQLERYVKTGAVLPEHLEFVAPVIDGLRRGGYTLYAELECAIREDWTATGWWDKGAWLRGKVDLIALKADEAIVIDYKTGKRKPDPTQLKIYAAMLKAVLKVPTVSSLYYWLKDKTGDHYVLNDSNFADTITEITDRITAMRDAYERDEFPARTGPLCGWCPALDGCKEAIYYKVQRDRKRR